MLASDKILALDIGASSVKIAEFHISQTQRRLRLTNFNSANLGLNPDQDENRKEIVIAAIRNILREKKIRPGKTIFSVPGQSVFTRFVKLPPVDESKVVQIIQYEAQQNVPFPIEEVIWDYQLLGSSEGGALEVVLFAIKSDIIEELTEDIQAAGLTTEMVDVAPMALYNAYLYNEGETPGCTLLLDLGARTTNLIFIEGSRVFTRSIPIAGNAITQSIAAEFNISFQEAEEFKKTKGFVALGGAYEEPTDPKQAQVSKIIRHVLTRLHSEIARSINFYRTQQGGSAPTRVMLSGGSSIMPYTDRFFSEKVQVPVEYFNPFRAVQVDDNIPREELSRCAHFFGEVVGLALRRMSECPIEVNLLPQSLRARKQQKQKRPYLAAAAISTLLIPLCLLVYSQRAAILKERQLHALSSALLNLQNLDRSIRQTQKILGHSRQQADQITTLVDERLWWPRFLEDINQRLVTNIWLISISPASSTLPSAETTKLVPSVARHLRDIAPALKDSSAGETAASTKTVVSAFRICGGGVHSNDDLKRVNDLKKLLSASPFFEKNGVEIEVPPPMTTDPLFRFTLRAKLSKPLIY